MFDPEPTHPLVQENGTDLYGMVAKYVKIFINIIFFLNFSMENIISVCVYKKFSDLVGEKNKPDIFNPENVATDLGYYFYYSVNIFLYR